MMDYRMKYALVVLCVVWSTNSKAVLEHVAKLAALRARSTDLMRVIAQEHAHKDTVKTVTLEIISPKSKYAPRIMREKDALGMTCITEDEDSHIMLNSKLKDKGEAEQTSAIFHELAHAYDPYFFYVEDLYASASVCDPITQDMFTYYPYLRNDVREYIAKLKAQGNLRAALKPLSYEWYADWQAAQWMLKYTPDQAEDLRDFYRNLRDHRLESLNAPEYAPLEVQIKWLEPKN